MQPFYDYFANFNNNHPCLYYIANDIILIEFLAGKLSNLKDKFHKPGKIHIIMLKQYEKMFIYRPLEHYYHLNVISRKKFLFQRFNIVFNHCAIDGHTFKNMYNLINDEHKSKLTDIVFRLGFTIPSNKSQYIPNVEVDKHIIFS